MNLEEFQDIMRRRFALHGGHGQRPSEDEFFAAAEAWENDLRLRFHRQTDLDDGRVVSTVLLMFDHGLGHDSELWFETALFNAEHKLVDAMRCETWEQAQAQHELAVLLCKEGREAEIF